MISDENKAPRIGPIILPNDSIEIHLPENGEGKHELNYNKYTPAPDRARNCLSLAQYCNHRAYRKILQRFGKILYTSDFCSGVILILFLIFLVLILISYLNSDINSDSSELILILILIFSV
ncbi:unnamed protein product [Meloidogyne enterolobii]|uniref:Uncharacterized protein n=1 Tax=Meloidogyne enterolobii TaxID=390850 RepID=A0ACB1ACG1_MELEN